MIAEEKEKAWKDRQAEIKYAMEEGIRKGRAEGERNRNIETAKNLLGMFIPIDQINKATGLSDEGIESLR